MIGARHSRIAALVATAVATCVLAGDATAQPSAGVGRAVGSGRASSTDSLTTRYEVDGIRVIHRRTNNNLVVANLYLLGGVSIATARTAGLEAMYLEVTERGTAKYPAERLRRAMARTGSEVGVLPADDWTVYAMRTTTERLDSTWSIYTDRLLAPTLAPADFAFVRANRLAAVQQRADSPDALLEYLADSVAFAGHPYALSPVGTASSLAAITHEDLLAFRRERIVKSRMLLVVVGNVERALLESMIRGSLGTLPAGDYRWSVPPSAANRPGSSVFIESRRLPTNYVLGWWSGPPAGHRDVPALRVASAILSGRLFNEVRSKRNLTYAVEARFRDRGLTTGGLYVTTTRPDTTLRIMRTELKNLQDLTLPTAYLAPLVQQFITEYFLDNETSGAQADFLARAELYQGDYRAGERFVDELRAVTGEDVRRVANEWMRNIRFAYVGNPSQVNRFLLMSF
jgi:zinc protease